MAAQTRLLLVSKWLSIRLKKCLDMRHVHRSRYLGMMLHVLVKEDSFNLSVVCFLAFRVPSFLDNAESVKRFVLCVDLLTVLSIALILCKCVLGC